MAINKTKRQLHTEEVKNRILKKAEEMFLTFGVEKVSMKELASSLDMTTGTIYHHFASKDDILEQISQRHAKMYMSNTDRYLQEEDSIQAIRDFFKEDMAEQVRRDGFIFTKHRILHLMDPDRPNRIHTFLEQIIKKGQQSEQIRKDLSAESAADILISLYRASCYEYVMSDGNEKYIEKIDHRISDYLEMIRK